MRAPTRDEPLVFESLVREYQDLAYSVAYRFLGSRQAAEDVTQEAFLRAYAARDRFVAGNPRAWLLRIVSNVALDELRQRRRRPQRSLDAMLRADDASHFEPADPRPSPETLAAQGDVRAALEHALGEQHHDARLVVLLSDVHDLSYHEIAAIMGLPVGTVKSRLSRARARLRRLLHRNGERRARAASPPAQRAAGQVRAVDRLGPGARARAVG